MDHFLCRWRFKYPCTSWYKEQNLYNSHLNRLMEANTNREQTGVDKEKINKSSKNWKEVFTYAVSGFLKSWWEWLREWVESYLNAILWFELLACIRWQMQSTNKKQKYKAKAPTFPFQVLKRSLSPPSGECLDRWGIPTVKRKTSWKLEKSSHWQSQCQAADSIPHKNMLLAFS